MAHMPFFLMLGQRKQVRGFCSYQGVTKKCRLSWLTNSALEYGPKYGERGCCEVSANEYVPTAEHMEPK
jgi:hypothetical protein